MKYTFKIKRKMQWSIGMAIMLLFFFEPAYFSRFAVIHTIFSFGKIFSFFYVLLSVFKKGKYPKLIVLILLYLIIQLIATLYNLQNIRNAIYEIICGIGVTCAIYYGWISNRENWLNSILIVFEFLIYGNFLSVLIAPNGLYIQRMASGWWTNLCWFLGIRNGMTLTYVLAAFYQIAYYKLCLKSSKASRLRSIFFFVVATITVLKISSTVVYKGSTTSAGGFAIAWGLILIYLLLVNFDKMLGWFDFIKGVIANYILAFMLVLLQVQNYFSWIIVVVLKKDLSMTGRTMIWDQAVNVIKKHWILGYGIPTGTTMSNRLNNLAAVTTTQNGFLDVVYTGGIILFTALILIFVCVSIHVKKYKLNEKNTFFLGYFIAVFLLVTQGESMGGMRLFTILVSIWCVAPMLKISEETI